MMKSRNYSYRWDKKDGIVNKQGEQVMQIVSSHCSEKFRNIAGTLLAERLNIYERKPDEAIPRQVDKFVMED